VPDTWEQRKGTGAYIGPNLRLSRMALTEVGTEDRLKTCDPLERARGLHEHCGHAADPDREHASQTATAARRRPQTGQSGTVGTLQ
jgi:hypothetical protein